MSRAWKRNVLWWFALAAAGLIFNAGVCYRSLVTLVDNSQQVVHSQKVINHLENTLSLVKDAETGQRGFILTGRDAYLQPYHFATEQLPTELNDLASLTGDQPLFAERLLPLREAIDEKMTELNRTLEMQKQGRHDDALQEVRTDRGKEMMDRVRSICSELMTEETRRVNERSEQSHSTAYVTQLTFALATIVDLMLLCFVAILIDRNLSQRERAAAALRKSEEQFRMLVDGARDYALVHLDGQGRVASWNSGAERLFGYPANAILGQSFSIFFPREEREDERQARAQLTEVAKTGRAEQVGWRVRADGSRFWGDGVLTPLNPLADKQLGFALMTRDVSERRQAEDALKASESRFRRLADAGLIGVMTVDLSGRIWEANDAFLSIVGYSRGDLDAGKLRWDEMTPAEFAALDQQATEQLRTVGKAEPYEKAYRRKDGALVPVLIGIALVEGAEDRCVCFVLDLTERKRAEEKVRDMNTTLERRVEERTHQLQESNQELESFSYSVSHDLRAPLRHLSGFADLLQKRPNVAADETSRRYVRVISEAAQNAGRLVDDLLAFSRMGRSELKKAPVSMSELVTQVIHELEPEVERRQVRWTIGILPAVPGDAAMLRQVIRNLLANALKYTRDRYPAEIHIGTLPSNENGSEKQVTFYVRDNGVGFDMKYVDKLFGVFQRLHSAEQFEGNGIGLANVRRIIGRHGGQTRAEGEPGKGATFFFTLPTAMEEVPA
jgi:PAS domain S-box-containing protein